MILKRRNNLQPNNIYQGDCLELMKRIPDKSIDMTITSPPYDNLRTYNNIQWNRNIWEKIIEQLFRITKIGGVVVWIVSDATINGSESCTSFRQALYFRQCGFNLHDTMIYIKNQLSYPSKNRYHNGFEYMFIFSNGRLKTFNPINDRKNISVGRNINGCERCKNGDLVKRNSSFRRIKKFGMRWNHWLIYNLSRGEHNKHPATFPYQLAHNHIISWSNQNDLGLDPLMGSGTTCVAAKLTNRRYIGIELDKKYFEIAKKRIANTQLTTTKPIIIKQKWW